jgi:hypothetical protein
MRYDQKGSNALLKEFRDLFEKIRKKGGVLRASKKCPHNHIRCSLDIRTVDDKTIRLTCYGRGNTAQVVEVNCADSDKLGLIVDIAKAKQIKLEQPMETTGIVATTCFRATFWSGVFFLDSFAVRFR